MKLDDWGREAQEQVKASRVLIAGAGGVGSAAALYLLAGGVGALRLVDNSRVRLADLSHQVLYREQDLGKAKAVAAGRRLQELNSFSLVEPLVKAISNHNVSRLAQGCRVLLDATNNSVASLLLQQAAQKLDIPLVHAEIGDLEGCLTTIWPGQGPCLACSCHEIIPSRRLSLLSPLDGILGALLALEALRIMGGLGPTLLGRLLCFHGTRLQFKERSLKPNPDCQACRASSSGNRAILKKN